jgi:hypothetical protein
LEQVSWQRLNRGGNTMRLGLLRQHTFRFVSMAFTLAILLVGVLDRDLLVHHVLVVHAGNSLIRGFEVSVRDKTIALGEVSHGLVARNLGRVHQRTKLTKCVVQRLLVHGRVEVTDEKLGANLDIPLLIGRRLVNAYPVSMQSDVVHNLRRIVCLGLGVEFDEAEALVLAVYAVDGHVDVPYTAGVEHQLVEEAGRDALMEVSHVDGGFLILLPAHVLTLIWPATVVLNRLTSDGRLGLTWFTTHQLMVPDQECRSHFVGALSG